MSVFLSVCYPIEILYFKEAYDSLCQLKTIYDTFDSL